MLKFAYAELNLFALAILLLIYLNIARRSERYLIEQKLFMALLGSNALILVLDTGMWVLDGNTDPFTRRALLLVTAAYYVMNPVVCMLWSFYADYQIYRDECRLKKQLLPMLIPVGINGLLSVTSIWTGLMFIIDDQNLYHRGSLFLMMAAISYGYLMNTFLLILKNHDRIQKQYYFPILSFVFPPFIGGLIQIYLYGVSLIWVCMTLSVLNVFVNIQNDQLFTDHLTGLFNRRQLDQYLLQRIRSSSTNDRVAGLMMDLDGFKQINDLYGHHIGDQALQNTADILRKTFRKCDLIARYGGDEFVVIMDAHDSEDLPTAVARLRENILQFNAEQTVPYTISLSIGFDYFDSRSGKNGYDYISHLDKLMYREKANKFKDTFTSTETSLGESGPPV